MSEAALTRPMGINWIGLYTIVRREVSRMMRVPIQAFIAPWISALLFIFIFGTLLSFYFYLKAVRLIGAQKTSLLSCAEPFAAAVLAVLWLGVRWTLMDWLGAALVLATIFLLARAKPEQKLLAEVTGDIRSH